jgi:hypothetical protein
MAEDISRRDAETLAGLRKQEVDITRELIDLRDKLVALSREDVINLEEVAKIQSQSLQLEKQRQGVTKQITSITGDALHSDEKRAKIQERANKNVEESIKSTKTMLKLSTEDAKKAEEREFAIKKAGDLVDDLNSSYKKVEQAVKNEVKYSDQLLKSKEDQTDAAKLLQSAAQDSDKEGGKYLRAAQELLNTNVLITTNIADRAIAEASAREGKFVELDISREMRGIRRAEVELENAIKAGNLETAAILQKEVAMLKEERDIKLEENKLNADLASQMKSILQTSEKIRGAIEATPIGGLVDSMSSAIKTLPGGDAINKALGVDSVADNIKKNLGDTMTNVVSGFQQGGMAGMKALAGGAKSFGMALMAGPQVVIIAMVAAVAGLMSLFNSADESVKEIQESMGGTKAEASKTLVAAQGMAQEMGMVGINTKEVAQGMATVSDIMGGLDVAAQIKSGNKELEQFAKDATVLSKNFGMSADEIGNIKSLATLTGESMGSLVKKSQGISKGLMTDKAAMKALADVPKSVAVAFKGGTESLIKASQKAKMLGMDLKKVQDIGDGMLDIESSLAKEMEARVLTGKNLNLDTARQFALAGDIAGLQDELLNQAGSLSDFQKMNRLQQKSMADAMGMSVDEMTEMLTKAQEYRDIGMDSTKISQLQSMNQQQLAEEMAKASTAEQRAAIEKIAKEKEAATMAEQLGSIMTKVQEKITALIAPLVDIVHSMFDAGDAAKGVTGGIDTIFAALTPVFDILVGVGKILWTVIKASFDNIMKIVSPIFDVIKSIFSSISAGSESTGGLVAVFDKISSVVGTILGVVGDLGGIIVTILVSPLKMLYQTIVTPLWKAFTGIFDVLSKAFEPLMGATKSGEETAGTMDKVKGIFEKLQPVIGMIGTIIGTAIVKPVEILGDLIGFVVKLFTGDFAGAANSVGKMIYEMFIGLPKTILTAIAGAIDSIFGTNLTKSVSGFFDFVTGIFGDIGNYVKNIGKMLLDYIMSPFNLISTVIDGIVQMFSGDFMGGLETIGGGIKDFIMAPFDLVSGLFDNLMGTIGKITDKVSGALSIFGIGGDEAEGETEKKAEETKKGGSASPLKTEATSAVTAKAEETKSAGAGAGAGVSMNPKDYPDGSRAQQMAMDGDQEGLKKEVQMMGAAATGGIIKKGGATLVGEKGPEVVSLPQGSVVANASATQQVGAAMDAMGGAGGEQTESPELAVLQSIDGKMSVLIEPLQKVGEMIGSVSKMLSGGLGSIAGNIMGSVGGAIGGLFGGGDEEKSSPITSVGQSPIQTSEIGATAGGGTTGGAVSAGGGASMKGVEGKLDQLIGLFNSIANQPTIIKFGDKTVEEIRTTIALKKTFNTEDNYGRKV